LGDSTPERLHHNVLAIALANKLARIAWAVLNKERDFEYVRTNETTFRPA
jgi:transposase